jgi:hypothetical protein
VPGDNGHLNPASKSRDYFRPLPNGLEPDGQKNFCNLRAHGEWIVEPNFADKDCETPFYDAAGIRLAPDRLRLRSAEAGRTNWVMFQVSAANTITSMRLDAEGLCDSSPDFLRISVSRNAGIHWEAVWKAEKVGPRAIHLKLREEVGGVPFCWIPRCVTPHQS